MKASYNKIVFYSTNCSRKLKLSPHCFIQQTRTIWEERNNALQESISRLKEELQRSEHNSSLKDQDLRKLQQELTESLLKVSITENTLEMSKKVGIRI